MRPVFLDHQSTTPVLPAVFEAMKPFFSEAFGSPSSVHQHGLRGRDALARARAQMAALINAESPDDIIFTAGGTETRLPKKNVISKEPTWLGWPGRFPSGPRGRTR